MGDIGCPGDRLPELLDYLNRESFRRLEDLYQRPYNLPLIKVRLRLESPNASAERMKKLLVLRQAEEIREKQDYALLLIYGGCSLDDSGNYGERLLNCSRALREHVKDCNEEGGCFDKYLRYVEQRVRERLESERAREVPKGEIDDFTREAIERVNFSLLDLPLDF